MRILPLTSLEGFENYFGYYVSDDGHVWSGKRDNMIKKLVPSHLSGRPIVWVYGKNRKKKGIFVNRIVAMAFIVNFKKADQVLHKNKNFDDCRVENLYWERKNVKKIKRKNHKEIVQEYENYDNYIVVKEEVVQKFNLVYEALRMKGGTVPRSIDFINNLILEALDNYISQRGLKKIIYSIGREG
jgi:hypothetical protein